MKRKIGVGMMMVGGVLMIAALALFIYNFMEDNKAGEASENLLNEVSDYINEEKKGQEIEIDGYPINGYISLPTLDRQLPIISEWSYERLKIAPCRYSGSIWGNDLVIAAHNYDRHFGRLNRLSLGDPIYIVDMMGMSHEYKVISIETLASTKVEEMKESKYDLTLFTCTYTGVSRITVRCQKVLKNESSV